MSRRMPGSIWMKESGLNDRLSGTCRGPKDRPDDQSGRESVGVQHRGIFRDAVLPPETQLVRRSYRFDLRDPTEYAARTRHRTAGR